MRLAVPDTLVTVPELIAVIVIEFDALVTVIPDPALIVAAAGLPAVEPITIWPSVNAIQVGTPPDVVVNTELLTVVKADITLAEDA